MFEPIEEITRHQLRNLVFITVMIPEDNRAFSFGPLRRVEAVGIAAAVIAKRYQVRRHGRKAFVLLIFGRACQSKSSALVNT